MIEARTDVAETYVEATTTPTIITTTMIIEDLDNGIDRDGIRTKYDLEKWEVAEMFKHPALKGKKVKKKRKLSFNFVDDQVSEAPAAVQVTLEDAIDTTIEALTTPTQDSTDENGDGYDYTNPLT